MKLLFISCVCSKTSFDYIYKKSKIKPLQSIQQFHKMLVSGLKCNRVDITALSEIPASGISNRTVILNSEQYDGICYHYLPFIKIPVIKAALHILSSAYFFLQWIWVTKKNKNERHIICDIFSYWPSITILLLSKIFRVKTCLILTDLPSMVSSISSQTHFSLSTITAHIGNLFLSKFDSYVFITSQMNEVVNKNQKPFIVMEGLVNCFFDPIQLKSSKSSNFYIMYSGGLYEKYGIKKLVDAFKYIPYKDIELHLYGDGELRDFLLKVNELDSRIFYNGVLPNSEIVKRQAEVDLLINPRSAKEEFTKYSFPIKNLEYMASGTPLLTTQLPGMPLEYFSYVYIIDDETAAGIADKIITLYNERDSIKIMGEKAKKFVMENKNYIFQGKRISEFLYKLDQKYE